MNWGWKSVKMIRGFDWVRPTSITKLWKLKKYIAIYLHVIKSQRSILLFSTEGALDFNSQRGVIILEKNPKKNFDSRG